MELTWVEIAQLAVGVLVGTLCVYVVEKTVRALRTRAQVTTASNQSPIDRDQPSETSTRSAAAATALLAFVSLFAPLVGGVTAMSTSHCDDTERLRAVCTQGGFWLATTGLLYLAFGGVGVAVLGGWIWPRRPRWAWIGAGYLMVFAGYVISLAISG
jgi:hypothetical protein